MGPQDFSTTTDPVTNKGIDWIGIASTVALGAIAGIALYLGQPTVAGTATGAIAGYMYRIYHQ